VDGPLKSGPVIEWAASFAAAMKADLRLVHAIPTAAAWPERQMNHEYEAVLREKAREQIERQMQAAKMHAPVHVVGGDVATAVRNEAIACNADLVIIGRGMLDETLGRLRTHAYSLIRSAPCPVISV
jgi:nucleotide-binding universal stress UspA family protein